MNTLPPEYSFEFDNPATYQIMVKGTLARGWSERLEGMAIRHTAQEDGTPLTILIGQLDDQTALAGVLNSLYELHLLILAVEKLPAVDRGHEESRPKDIKPMDGRAA